MDTKKAKLKENQGKETLWRFFVWMIGFEAVSLAEQIFFLTSYQYEY